MTKTNTILTAALCLVAPAMADQPEVDHIKASFTSWTIDECTGEQVNLAGEYRATVIIPADGISYRIMSSVEGVGIGATSGLTYKYTGEQQQTATIAVHDGCIRILFDAAHLKLISQSSSPNLHLTVWWIIKEDLCANETFLDVLTRTTRCN